ncbi:MAG TPA: TetR/AcrR family transcriptional regulator [Terriglobales bacterium]|nr:TetR/AcrR family transcriptional regulator [Terriglobales bacterium]
MASDPITRSSSARRNTEESRRRESERFEQRLGEILEHATDVFYEKGYQGASMRDLSRASGMSLAGLYYYFESKERLLYLIQKHTFNTVLGSVRGRLQGVSNPEQRVRAFITNHVEYFLKNRKAMTVLSHEDETLTGELGKEVAELKREYYKLCVSLVDELRGSHPEFDSRLNTRLAVLSLFGMMNWIYTWHNARVDADSGELAGHMCDIFLHGVLSAEPASQGSRKDRATASKASE